MGRHKIQGLQPARKPVPFVILMRRRLLLLPLYPTSHYTISRTYCRLLRLSAPRRQNWTRPYCKPRSPPQRLPRITHGTQVTLEYHHRHHHYYQTLKIQQKLGSILRQRRLTLDPSVFHCHLGNAYHLKIFRLVRRKYFPSLSVFNMLNYIIYMDDPFAVQVLFKKC